ncbi:MAG: hypothetical protein RIQ38_1605 [Pseudomonadota bacterium]|jgi:predicted porin
MKKSLIALAALAATASFAQSSVTIKGTFDPSLVTQKNTYGNGNTVSQTNLQNSRQGTSQVTFFGTEDLGGGLKASFLIENDFHAGQAISSTNLFSGVGGELFVGLSNNFGSVKIGAANTPTLFAQASANPFGTKTGSGFGAMNAGKVRNSNSFVFSATPVAGLTLNAAYAAKTNADANPSTAVTAVAAVTDLGFTYVNGPLAVGYTNYKVEGAGAALDNTLNNAYLTYDLGVAKLGAGYYTEKNGAAAGASTVSGFTDSKAYNFGLWVPMGAVTLMANYAKKDDKAAANNDRTVTAVGAKYELSKRTSLYGRYVTDKTVGTVNNAAAAKSTYTILGLQHNF